MQESQAICEGADYCSAICHFLVLGMKINCGFGR